MKWEDWAKVGAGALVGGALIAATGGAAAPLVAAEAGSVAAGTGAAVGTAGAVAGAEATGGAVAGQVAAGAARGAAMKALAKKGVESYVAGKGMSMGLGGGGRVNRPQGPYTPNDPNVTTGSMERRGAWSSQQFGR